MSVEGGDALNCTLTKLRPGACYQAYVRAWKLIDGEKNYGIQTCPTVHAYTGGGAKGITNPAELTLTKDALIVRLGRTANIRADVKGETKGRRMAHHVPKLRYISGNPDVATVSAAGKVKAVGNGECSVFVMTTNGIWEEVKITVDASPTRAAFGIGKNQVYEGEALDLSKRLRLTPEGADTTLKWTSSRPEVASVDGDGVVTGLTAGKTTITAETDNGKKAKLTLTVILFSTQI